MMKKAALIFGLAIGIAAGGYFSMNGMPTPEAPATEEAAEETNGIQMLAVTKYHGSNQDENGSKINVTKCDINEASNMLMFSEDEDIQNMEITYYDQNDIVLGTINRIYDQQGNYTEDSDTELTNEILEKTNYICMKQYNDDESLEKEIRVINNNMAPYNWYCHEYEYDNVGNLVKETAIGSPYHLFY